MAKTQPFDEHANTYEDWFEKNTYVYESELAAVKALLPKDGKGTEIGVGSGRFAARLDISFGVEPSEEMRNIAKQRGIEVIDGIAEDLPLEDAQFDFALMVTTICFLDDIDTAFQETYRILKPGGYVLIGFVDKNSPIGKQYQKHKHDSAFYRVATFYSTDEVVDSLSNTGFYDFHYTQTIFNELGKIHEGEPVKEGYGEGSFVVIRARVQP